MQRGPKPNPWQRPINTLSDKIYLPMLLLVVSVWGNPASGAEQCYGPSLFGNDSNDQYAAGSIDLTADESETTGPDQIKLTGHVNVRIDETQITAETITYDQQLDQIDAEGAVVLKSADLIVESSSLQMNLASDTGTIENASYALREKRARGQAVRIIRHSPGLHDLEQAVFTTCPPGRRDWQLSAKEITLNQETGVGTAKHMVVRFKDLPFFYTPYASFPLTKARKSGFLTPSFGSSSDDGTELTTPYYWNIAPNYDALITPRYIEERGLLTEVSLRHLFRKNSGITNFAYMASDDRTDEDRKAFFWTLDGKATSRLSYDVDYNYVSDKQYFEDFGDDIASTSIDHLRRQGAVTYAGRGWNLRTNFEGYQTISGTRPYQRLPQVTFLTDGELADGLIEYNLNAESTWFDSDTKVDGTRIDLYPRMNLLYERSAYFLEPALGLRYTRYDLDGQRLGLDDDPDRFTPIVSLDSGLFFERDVDLWGFNLLNTLEPRAFYLYVPERDQDDIPLFDTDEQDINAYSLFSTNRFSGADRQGDANQLTLALTSRMLTNGGSEVLKASVGQIIYFEDREVGLYAITPDDNDSTSEYVTELSARLSRNLSTRASWQWDPNTDASTKGTVSLAYRRDARHILNLGYRYRIDDIEQTDFSVAWPLTKNWSFVGRSNYSLREDKSLDNFAGLEYDSCCWAVRVVSRHWVKNIDDDMNHALMVQVELKGLTSIGNPIRDLLADGILGYELDDGFRGNQLENEFSAD